MNHEAFILFNTLNEKDYSDSISDTLENFILYLYKLSNDICPKGLKDKFILEWTFKYPVNKDNDYKSYCKANIFSACSSLKRISQDINKDNFNDVTKRLLINFVCDLKPFIEYFDKNQDYSWLAVNTNSHITNFYFDLSKSIFNKGNSGEHPEEKLVLSSTTPFLIRQSIEYKVKRCLGVDFWLKNGKPDIRTTETCFEIIKRIDFFKTENIDFDIVKNIHSWTNLFIHGGYRAEPWKTETAINYLSNLFNQGENSLFAGIKVFKSDVPKIKEITERYIRLKEAKNEIYIRWRNKPEVAIISG